MVESNRKNKKLERVMATSFNALLRLDTITQFRNKTPEFDVVIIGGGITGAGILLDAVSRGLSAVVIEKNDFSSGTSSRSTKLIHGGLRYLKQLEFKIVRETGQERAIAYRNAPHLVVPEKMVLPIIEGGTYGKFATAVGLYVYDRMAKVRKEDRRKMLAADETIKLLPTIKKEGLLGSGFYSEYRTDDSRLTLSIIKTAVERGGVALNYVTVTEFLYNQDGKVEGVKMVSREGEEVVINGKKIVNAAGPWSDELRKINKSLTKKRLHLTKGVHIVVDRNKFQLEHSVYFDMPDKRMIFAIPRGRIVYIGTTDTNYNGDKERVAVEMKDVDYLLNGVNSMFPAVQLAITDVESSWAGLRPLIHQEGKAPSALSRKDEVFESESGLITISGGKLTGYRLMAKKIVDKVAREIGRFSPCTTDHLNISGFPKQGVDGLRNELLNYAGMTQDMANYLIQNYGEDSKIVISELKVVTDEVLIEAEARYCLDHECVLSLIDFYTYRSGRMYFDINSVSLTKDAVSLIFKEKLQWDDDRLRLELSQLNDAVLEKTNFK
jgi:glycerol-3-phosphate dehydrogenase